MFLWKYTMLTNDNEGEEDPQERQLFNLVKVVGPILLSSDGEVQLHFKRTR